MKDIVGSNFWLSVPEFVGTTEVEWFNKKTVQHQ